MILAYAPTQMADKTMHIFHAVWSEEFSNKRQTDTDPRREWESVCGVEIEWNYRQVIVFNILLKNAFLLNARWKCSNWIENAAFKRF